MRRRRSPISCPTPRPGARMGSAIMLRKCGGYVKSCGTVFRRDVPLQNPFLVASIAKRMGGEASTEPSDDEPHELEIHGRVTKREREKLQSRSFSCTRVSREPWIAANVARGRRGKTARARPLHTRSGGGVTSPGGDGVGSSGGRRAGGLGCIGRERRRQMMPG